MGFYSICCCCSTFLKPFGLQKSHKSKDRLRIAFHIPQIARILQFPVELIQDIMKTDLYTFPKFHLMRKKFTSVPSACLDPFQLRIQDTNLQYSSPPSNIF